MTLYLQIFWNIFLGALLLRSVYWAMDYFGISCFEQILFHLKVPLEGASPGFLRDWLRVCLPPALIAGGIGTLLHVLLVVVTLNLSRMILFFCILYGLYHTGLFEYISNCFQSDDLYETEYADPAVIPVTPPDKKRNLIHIYLESMETTYTDRAHGGNAENSLLPFLTELTENNLSFSHGEQIGGFAVVTGTGWTTAGIAAAESGAPLLFPAGAPFARAGKPFCPGLFSLGDRLYQDGYRQVCLLGSDATSGGRRAYYRQHGDFDILDLPEMKHLGYLPENYHAFRGFEDDRLFAFAKDELLRLSAEEEPFHLTMLTADTHHPHGYQGKTCRNRFDPPMSNSIYHTDELLRGFIEWLKQQSFYEDTTVVIQGDHTSMATEYIRQNYDADFDRRVWNVFLHPQASPVREIGRQFTAFDMYPTILRAMGYEIEGNRLGLGTDLFSASPTLAEEIGLSALDERLRRRSDDYRKRIFFRKPQTESREEPFSP